MGTASPQYVVKVEDLGALNHLPVNCPAPINREWINRGLDRPLKPSNADMLLRTLHNEIAPPSIVKLHRSAGLRLVFSSETERLRFAAQMVDAKAKMETMRGSHCSATFDSMEEAKNVVAELIEEGIGKSEISMLWRANLFMDPEIDWHEGHSTMSIAGAASGGGIAGTAFALGLLAIPGLGPIVAAGAMASGAIAALAAFGGVAGATGGAIARMLTDQDVDGVAASYYEQQIERGKILVSVKLSEILTTERELRKIFRKAGGKIFAWS
ncbi:MAG: hypothetical protein ABJP48_08395 [Erythrobacter sp.]